MAITVSASLPEETAERLEERARVEDRPVEEVVSRAIEEYLQSARFPGIIFVTGGSGRRKAKVSGGPAVWSIVFTARTHGMDLEKTADYLQIPVQSVRLALDYYATYPEDTDDRLRRMEEVADNPGLLHPSVRVVSASEL